MKSDAKKVDADAKKIEKEAKAKKSDKVSESKAEQSPRIVRPVRRSTLKPLDQKQQETLEIPCCVSLLAVLTTAYN